VAGCCGHGNEPSVPVKGAFVDWLSYLDSQEGLCSIDLVIRYYALNSRFGL
jgi:hypothetical protein